MSLTGRHDLTALERFWLRVQKGPGCWVWTGAPDEWGYGYLMARGVGPGRIVKAHRFSWLIHRGPIPTGMRVCHSCDNPPCVRPDHLFIGTDGDNARDSASKGRHHCTKKTVCPKGHPYSGRNLVMDRGRRTCRACRTARRRRSRFPKISGERMDRPRRIPPHRRCTMNQLDRLTQREDRKALAARLKEAVDAGRVKVEDAVRATRTSPETVAGWMAGLQIPQKKAARRLERFLAGA